MGVIIWTYNYNLTEIKMHYYWNYWNGHLEQFEFEMIKIKNSFENWTSGRILPASSYETIYNNLYIKFGEKEKDEKELFKEDEKWIQFLCSSCVDKCLLDNHLIFKIPLLNIIFENFKELSENHPALVANVLSLIGYVVSSNIVIPNSHLSSYGRYYQLSKTSFFDVLTFNLWISWISFQESFRTSFKNFNSTILDVYYWGHSSTILAIPLPNFISYPKDYNFWEEVLLLPSPNPNGTIEENSSLIKSHTVTTNKFMTFGSSISTVVLMLL
ncbi:14045_t:CDS:2, partial [Racocetra persica]